MYVGNGNGDVPVGVGAPPLNTTITPNLFSSQLNRGWADYDS